MCKSHLLQLRCMIARPKIPRCQMLREEQGCLAGNRDRVWGGEWLLGLGCYVEAWTGLSDHAKPVESHMYKIPDDSAIRYFTLGR